VKKLLLAYSLLPLVWVITAIIFNHFGYHPHDIFIGNIMAFVYVFYFPFGIGLVGWLGFLIYMKTKRKISNTEMIINIIFVCTAISLFFLCGDDRVIDYFEN
jgi:hypothetical protein